MDTQYNPTFKVMLAGVDITADVSASIIHIRYEDSIEGESDECSIECENIDGRWFNEWYPKYGDHLQISLGYGNDLIEYSKCEIAEITFNRYPDTVEVTALSTGVKSEVRDRKSTAFTNTTLKGIVQKLATLNKFKVVGEIKHIPINRITQYQETDVAFLLRLATTYGHSFKIVEDQLVFMDLDKLKEQDAVRVIDYAETISFSITDKIKDVYAEIQLRQQNNKKKQSEQVTRKLTDKERESKQMRVMNVSYQNRSEGNAKADAALKAANDEKTLGDIEVIGDPLLVAGSVVKLTGIGKLTGLYLITKSVHEKSQEGYRTGFDVKRIDEKEEKDAKA